VSGRRRSAAGGELTASLKLRRHIVLQRHAAVVEALYASEPDGACA
jgi:long-subunit acyl-CoA synthetase (AMP-forming)